MLCSEEYRDIEEKVLRGERLSREDGIRLFHCRDIAWLGALADTVRRRKCGDVVYYNVNCHVNLIPVNPIKERDYVQSNAQRIEAFKEMLEKNRITVTVRREMGRDIDGACGQLRRRYMNSHEK